MEKPDELMPGGRFKEQWGIRVWRDDDETEGIEPMDFMRETRESAEAGVASHQRNRKENPNWIGNARLIHRVVYTEPWQVVE